MQRVLKYQIYDFSNDFEDIHRALSIWHNEFYEFLGLTNYEPALKSRMFLGFSLEG